MLSVFQSMDVITTGCRINLLFFSKDLSRTEILKTFLLKVYNTKDIHMSVFLYILITVQKNH